MKKPWPAVRVPEPVEPAALVGVRNESPAVRGRPAADPGGRARLTLAVSAAILLGGCWYLSNGWQPADRPVRGCITLRALGRGDPDALVDGPLPADRGAAPYAVVDHAAFAHAQSD